MERSESTARAREPWAGRRPRHEEPLDPPREPGRDEAHGPPPPPSAGGVDFSPLFALLDALRRAVPGDLQNQFTAFVREALIALRGLIDWYLERLERPRREPRVEDIPID